MNISSPMLPYTTKGEQGQPLFVMLHWLGGSARTFTELSAGLALRGLRCAAIDLPGFGDASTATEFSIAAMRDEVVATIAHLRSNQAGPWFLVGHSMGGKLSMIVARAAADGSRALDQLAGIVLISSSPPGPEPMKESKRSELLKSLGQTTGDAKQDEALAAKFVDENTGKFPLQNVVRERAVTDILRMNRSAFRAWLNTGSREDWSDRVGTLALPALVLAGSEDPALGPAGQRSYTLPHLSAAQLVIEQGGGHLGPLERPAELVYRVAQFVEACGIALPHTSGKLGAHFTALITSQQTSSQTRVALLARMDDSTIAHEEQILDEEQQLTLRALAQRVIPGCSFDLADRVMASLRQTHHDGWRNDRLPDDAKAWAQGLDSLDAAASREYGVNFGALDNTHQEQLLVKAKAGELGKGLLGSLRLGTGAASFDAEQMRVWFEDVRAELSKWYVADPRTMERMRFTGFADDGGFTQIELGQREEFEL